MLRFCLIIFLFSASANIYAQIDMLFTGSGSQLDANSSFKFLTLPAGARGTALRESFIAMADDGSLNYWNPSALSRNNRYCFYFAHQFLYGLTREYSSLSVPSKRFGTYGIFFNSLASWDDKYSRDADEMEVSVNTQDFSGGFSYGDAFLNDMIQTGCNVKIIQSNLADENATTFAIDAAAGSRIPKYDLNIAFQFKNFGFPAKYISEKEYLPTGILIGTSKKLADDQLTLGLGTSKYVSAPYRISLGADYKPVDYFRVFGSYGYSFYGNGFKDRSPVDELGVGFGLSYRFLSFDYSFNRKETMGDNAHTIALEIRLAKLKPLTAEDFYELAKSEFSQGKYKNTVNLCQRALGKNPKYLDAQILLQESSNMLKRLSGMVLAVIYTGNTNGYFFPVQGQLGGLPRRAGLIKTLKMKYPFHLVVDCGDFISKDDDSLKFIYGFKILKKMGYNVSGLGIYEASFGPELLEKYGKEADLEYVGTNYWMERKGSNLSWEKIITIPHGRKSYRAAILSVIDKKIASAITQKENKVHSDPFKALDKAIRFVYGLADITIVTAHGDLEFCKEIAEMIPDINVIICNDTSIPLYKPIIIGNTLIVSPGSDGKHVGLLSFNFSWDQKLISFNNHIYALDNEIEDDPEIAGMLNHLRVQFPAATVEIPETYGRVAYLSDSSDAGGIYLNRVFEKKNIYIPVDINKCRNLKLSHCGTKIIFTELLQNDLARLNYYSTNDGIVQNLSGDGLKIQYAAWSADDNFIYTIEPRKYEDSIFSELYRFDYKRQIKINISRTENANEYEIEASPNNLHIAFTSDRDGYRQIYVSRIKGEKPSRVSWARGNCSNLHWSPDAKKLAYSCNSRAGMYSGGDLYVVDLNTDSTIQLTNNVNVHSLCWLNSDQLVISSGINFVDLNVLHIKTRKMVKLAKIQGYKTYSETHPQIIFDKNKNPFVVYQVQEKDRYHIEIIGFDGNGITKLAASGNYSCW
ncbi:MAG: hypothetical protein ABIA63_07875, partial [bacterium]